MIQPRAQSAEFFGWSLVRFHQIEQVGFRRGREGDLHHVVQQRRVQHRAGGGAAVLVGGGANSVFYAVGWGIAVLKAAGLFSAAQGIVYAAHCSSEKCLYVTILESILTIGQYRNSSTSTRSSRRCR